MGIIESDNRHSVTTRKGLEYLKELSASTDGWTLSSESNGVKVYTRKVEGTSLPIVRGDTVLEGDHTVEQVVAVALSSGCRQIWDDRFDSAEMKEYFTHHEALFHSKQKGQWPVSGRDIAGTSIRDVSDDLVYISMTSVEDPAIPPISSHVRAHLYISGWKIYKVPNGVALTYITHIDIKGTVPAAFLKAIMLQIPQCAGRVVKYVKDNGYPPFIVGEFAGRLKSDIFDHAKRVHVLEVEGTDDEEGLVKIEIGNVMHPNGFKFKVHGEATSEEIDGENGVKYLVVSGYKSPVTITISRP
ncbi:hypothetical protein BC937DRAFT_91301 [Endogone sp. FLAS-F59071]|nr:hypothetical protein BC937DRAFT_91301 [Endogone sp. FLAS-F59071]|eukprot:RUS16355.1 hypothetical protein BC937DRAFT_91301 [Endogone sp. FLAS-F59071]